MKRVFISLIILLLVGAGTLFGILYAYSMTKGGTEDLDRLKEFSRLYLFQHGFIDSLSRKETVRLYQSKCYRQCHGEAVMITAVLPPAGWMQIIERMRVRQGAKMTGREAEAIIRYMEIRYPARSSRFPYTLRRAINRLLWRNDVGYGDLYVDVIYATPVYFDSIEARNLIDEYEADKSLVFLISLTVHEGRAKHYPLGKMACLRVGGKEYAPIESWKLRFETSDGHHMEGLLRFAEKDPSGKDILSPDAKGMELIIRGLETTKDRIYQWDLPIKYPDEYEKLSKEN